MDVKSKQKLIPYTIVWNMVERIPCLIVNIDDCDEKTRNEFKSNSIGKVPVRYFSDYKRRQYILKNNIYSGLVYELYLTPCNQDSNKIVLTVIQGQEETSKNVFIKI